MSRYQFMKCLIMQCCKVLDLNKFWWLDLFGCISCKWLLGKVEFKSIKCFSRVAKISAAPAHPALASSLDWPSLNFNDTDTRSLSEQISQVPTYFIITLKAGASIIYYCFWGEDKSHRFKTLKASAKKIWKSKITFQTDKTQIWKCVLVF